MKRHIVLFLGALVVMANAGAQQINYSSCVQGGGTQYDCIAPTFTPWNYSVGWCAGGFTTEQAATDCASSIITSSNVGPAYPSWCGVTFVPSNAAPRPTVVDGNNVLVQQQRISETFTYTGHQYGTAACSAPSSGSVTVTATRSYGCSAGYTNWTFDFSGNYLCARYPNGCAPYPNNITSGCGKAVADLDSAARNTPSSDPTYGFVVAHFCIAKAGCNHRCTHDNCRWMDEVVPRFVRPFIEKQGNWSPIEKFCRTKNTMHNRFPLYCEREMAKYHINVDLLNALVAGGCGSDADWQDVGNSIATCTQERLGATFFARYVSGQVKDIRDEVRATCRQRRQNAGQPLDMNPGTGGKVCVQ